jgi:2-methylisocitrate lyase-like PEP mutase family enzyme
MEVRKPKTHTPHPSKPLTKTEQIGPANVYTSVQAYIRSGISAFHIEDQSQQKRCGHLSNKQIVSLTVFLSRIRAAVAARKAASSDIVLIARTDALAVHGYDEALVRLQAARDAGADMGFLEGVEDETMMSRVVRDLAPWPVLLNMVEAGKTPTVSVQRAREIGFRVIIWPFAPLAPAIVAMREAYAGLKDTGLVPGKKMTPKEIFEICGLEEWMRIDRDAGGEDFKAGA